MLLFAWDTWQRRWIADDGLIVVRTVREILAGHGPTYNIFERAESNTSALWTWLVAGAAWITRANVTFVTIALGGLLAVGGLAGAMLATKRFHELRGSRAVLVPAGALVVLAVIPFWDYATSGLESGLGLAWLAAIWWLLVTLRPGRELATAIVIGLGPLVRPDFGIASIVFLVAAWSIVRPSWRGTLVLGAAAIALPFAYEIFRAGYYGTLVPLPALAKSASGAAWHRGLGYALDFARPYALVVPAAVFALLTGIVAWRRLVTRRDVALLAAPLVTALLMLLFVVRVGGDFMHARMMLPPLFVGLLPVMLLPLRQVTAPFVGVLVGWALFIGIKKNDRKPHTSAEHVEDERCGYVRFTHHRFPVRDEYFIKADGKPAAAALEAIARGDRRLMSEDGLSTPLSATAPASIVYAAGRLGTGGVIVPLEGIVADTLGLANPLGARITPTLPGYPGHEKPLPRAWLLADFADPAHDDDRVAGVPPNAIRAARHAMTCGALAEMLASAREPMSPRRFWDNLVGAVGRTRLVIPSDPFDAERAFCGADANEIQVATSSAYTGEGWNPTNLTDGDLVARPGVPGFSSQGGRHDDHEEWIDLRLPRPRLVAGVTLYPAANDGEGFPVTVSVATWEGEHWVTKATRTDLTTGTQPVSLAWAAATTSRIRITATHLRLLRGEYVAQLAEVVVDSGAPAP